MTFRPSQVTPTLLTPPPPQLLCVCVIDGSQRAVYTFVPPHPPTRSQQGCVHALPAEPLPPAGRQGPLRIRGVPGRHRGRAGVAR